MEAYLDGIPRSTSSGTLSTSDSTRSDLNQQATRTGTTSTPGSYWLTGISSVWSGLKAAAGVEVKGFLKAAGFDRSSGVPQLENTGDKRPRRPSVGGRDTGDLPGSASKSRDKRRRLERPEDSQLLTDQVPPLMPPISPAPRSRHHSDASPASGKLASSPETARKRLRPYADSSYADQLMNSDQWTASSSSRNSNEREGLRSSSSRRRLEAGATAGVGQSVDTGATTAMSSSRARSFMQIRDRSQPNHHVQFALPPSSVSRSAAKSPVGTKRNPEEEVGSVLLGSVGSVWQQAKEHEKTTKTRKRIADLENEVVRLKTELSSKTLNIPPPLPVPPKSPYKSPRHSDPPPPPPPPPPPRHGDRPSTHPVLFTARASLRATPPRPSHKRRSSAIGGVQDMDAFLGELGEKRGKLRKVGFPTKDRSAQKGEGELTQVLQKAFARKFAKTNGLASPSFDTPLQSSKSSSNLQLPQWSSSTLSTSRSHPTQLSSHLSPLAPPTQPVFSSTARSETKISRLPRTTSLASTETTVFGHAISIDAPQNATSKRSMSSRLSSPPSAPPEPPRSSTSTSPVRIEQGDYDAHAPTLTNATPRRSSKPAEDGQGSATNRLSAARKRSSLTRLPGLDAGSKRPITPGRSKRKSAGGGGSSPLVKIEAGDESLGTQKSGSHDGVSVIVDKKTVLEGEEDRKGHTATHRRTRSHTGSERHALQSAIDSSLPDSLIQGTGTKSPRPEKASGKA